jgi:phospholipase/carboxylesterase
MTEAALLPSVTIDAEGPHRATVIWLHGLGDSGNGFAPIVPALQIPASLGVKFIFPHAPMRAVTINNGMQMRAWYDLKSMDFGSRADLAGVLESVEQVTQLIEAEMAAGIPANKILLAGFSQGGVITYHLGCRFPHTLAGMLCLSTYMAEPQLLAEQKSDAGLKTPIFAAHGTHDDVVPMKMGEAAFHSAQQNGFDATWHTYPMQHNVHSQEIHDLSQWLQARLA